ncbi:MAG: tRNA lysidine(34) synthetase TilS, partial [Bacteroidota bacterium]
MSLLNDFTAHLSKEHLLDPKGKFILAVSGGLDSLVLCDLCAQAGFDFSIAHCNFQLRGEESDADEQFVVETGSSYGKEVRVNRFDTERYADSHKLSIQAAARELRYQWFKQLVLEERSGHYLLTAHHADDNLETIVMNFFRGTGLAGLRGILPVQGHLIRPLLPFHRELLEAYARERKLKWREDSSNITDTYTRNFFRHQVLPLIQTRYPEASQNILGNAHRMGEVEQVYREAIGRYRKELMKKQGEEGHLSVGKLKGLKPIDTHLFDLFHPFGFTAGQLPVIKELLDADTGRSVRSS